MCQFAEAPPLYKLQDARATAVSGAVDKARRFSKLTPTLRLMSKSDEELHALERSLKTDPSRADELAALGAHRSWMRRQAVEKERASAGSC